jgi:HAD superfamily hydrolase (TIGR01662 family)
MIKAYLFDFNATLMRSPAWMDLEITGLPKQAFDLMAEQGHISALSKHQQKRAEISFSETRIAAEETEQESSHLDDLRAMVQALGLNNQISQILMEETIATLHRNCVSDVTLIDGVSDTLLALKARGFPLGIISNAAYSPFLIWTLTQNELINHFDDIIVSADVGIRKPKTEIFDLSLERMNLKASETAYIGDDIDKDVGGANKAGMLSIWFNPKNQTVPSDALRTPFANISAFTEILDLVQPSD